MKILILTASPMRDAIVDELLAEALEKRGHTVIIKKCLREGRKAVLQHKPDTVVMPPIRNPYSSDMAEVIKSWGIGLVSRHTEPSCDKQDFERMEPKKKFDIFGRYPYAVDAEIVWSQDEADILNQRKTAFKAHAVGAFTVDVYKRPDVINKHRDKKAFLKKHNFSPEKKTLLVCSPWGFADAAPDLHVGDLDYAKKDTAGRDRHFAMLRHIIPPLRDQWNILVSVHPGVVQGPYKELCSQLQVPLDTESRSFDLNIHVDAMIHAGSTMAINAHFLKIPAWQFGDVNAKEADSWWSNPDAAISKISPYCKNSDELLMALKEYRPGTNADNKALKMLEKGRFGRMDGKATERTAAVIDTIKGKFSYSWPVSPRDYSQLTLARDPRRIYTPMGCAICGKEFAIVNESYLRQITNHIMGQLEPYFSSPPAPEVMNRLFVPQNGDACPWCAARFFRGEMS